MTDPAHEARTDREIDLRALGAFVALLAVLVAVALGISRVAVDALDARAAAADPVPAPVSGIAARWLPPAPRLSSAPREELLRARAEDDALLSGWGWTDTGAGLVRVPIERAVELVLARGLPPAEPAPTPPEDIR